jgi:hypothetical protein
MNRPHNYIKQARNDYFIYVNFIVYKRRKFAVSGIMKEQTFPACFSLLIKINKTGKSSCLNQKRVKKNGNSGSEDPNPEDIRRNVYKSGTRWRRVVWIYVPVSPPPHALPKILRPQ